jgi:TolA-binding protein
MAGFREFLQTWPDHAQAASATLQLARLLVDAKQTSEAVALLQPFKTKYPGARQAADAQFLLGWVKSTSGDARAGAADLRAFVAAYPSHPQVPTARRLLTQTLAQSSDRDEMLEAYKNLMEQQPASADAIYTAAQLATRLARPRDQEAAWKRLSTEFPDHALTRRVALDRANAAFRDKDWKGTVALAQQAVQSDDGAVKAEALLLVGESELKQKRFASAAKAFDAVTDLEEADAGVRFRALAGLGLAREEQQEWKAALTAYESVLNRSPDATLRDWARERAKAMRARLDAAKKPAPKAAPKPAAKPAPKPAPKEKSKP